MMEQRTAEWFAARRGKITASRIKDVLAKDTTKAHQNYRNQLIAERLSGTTESMFVNDAMRWGTETEPQARSAYEFLHQSVEETGFHDHPTLPMCGASPDGLVGTDRLVEFKCPNTTTHLQTIITGKIDPQYQLQMLWQMDCTQRTGGCDFVTFDPRLPQMHLRVFVIPFEWDEIRASEVREKVREFEAGVTAEVERLLALGDAANHSIELEQERVA